MEEKLLETINDNLQKVKTNKEKLIKMIQDVEEGNTENADSQMRILIKDKKQLEEALKNEKNTRIQENYKSDLDKVNAEIEKWKQDKLTELKALEDDEKDKNKEIEFVESYKKEKVENEKINAERKEKRENLLKNKKQAEDELNKLTNNGKKVFYKDGKPAEVIECEKDLENITKKLDELNIEEEKSNKKFDNTKNKFEMLCDKYEIKEKIKQKMHYEDLAKKIKEQAHYENIADELVAQSEKEKEQEQNEDELDQNDEVEIGEQGDNVEEVTFVDAELAEEYAPVAKEYVPAAEEHDENEIEDEEEKKPGFFKRLFNKIKDAINKVVSKIKNRFKKLTSKDVKALDSAKEKIEEIEGQEPEELKEQEKELEGVRAEVDLKDNEEVMQALKGTEEKFKHASEATTERTYLKQPNKSDLEGPEQ